MVERIKKSARKFHEIFNFILNRNLSRSNKYVKKGKCYVYNYIASYLIQIYTFIGHAECPSLTIGHLDAFGEELVDLLYESGQDLLQLGPVQQVRRNEAHDAVQTVLVHGRHRGPQHELLQGQVVHLGGQPTEGARPQVLVLLFVYYGYIYYSLISACIWARNIIDQYWQKIMTGETSLRKMVGGRW